MYLKKITLIIFLFLTACSADDNQLTKGLAKVQLIEKSPYYQTPLQAFLGTHIVRVGGKLYTTTDIEGYVNEGTTVSTIESGSSIKEICQILSEELSEFRRCFSLREVKGAS